VDAPDAHNMIHMAKPYLSQTAAMNKTS